MSVCFGFKSDLHTLMLEDTRKTDKDTLSVQFYSNSHFSWSDIKQTLHALERHFSELTDSCRSASIRGENGRGVSPIEHVTTRSGRRKRRADEQKQGFYVVGRAAEQWQNEGWLTVNCDRNDEILYVNAHERHFSRCSGYGWWRRSN